MTIGTIELIQGLLIAFLLVVVLMPPYIRFARQVRFGKHIRVDGPQSHYLKEGTPTGAGILIVLVGGEGRTHEILQGLHVGGAGTVWAAIVAPAALTGDPYGEQVARPRALTSAAAD